MKRLSLEVRLQRAKDHAAKYALRDPRKKEDYLQRSRWERLNHILWRRYNA
jgi:hypothetical protein